MVIVIMAIVVVDFLPVGLQYAVPAAAAALGEWCLALKPAGVR